MLYLCSAVVLCQLWLVSALPELKSKVNVTLEQGSDHFCFAIANATHRMGCQSNRFGQSGVVHMVDKPDDLHYIHDNPGVVSAFVPVVTAHFMHTSKDELLKLLQRDIVVGLIILLDLHNITQYSFSGDNQCPDHRYLSKEQRQKRDCTEWNPNGRGLWFHMIHKPYVVVHNATETALIKRCFNDYNKPNGSAYAGYPLCAADLTNFQNLGGNSEICERRSDKQSTLYQVHSTISQTMQTGTVTYCDPYGTRATSMIAVLPPSFQNGTDQRGRFKNDSVLMVTTRLDALSLIMYMNPGAETVVTGLATLLIVAHALGQDKDELLRLMQDGRANHKFIVFAAIDNEALGHTGSIRMLYDMQLGHIPKAKVKEGYPPDKLRLEHIGAMLDLQQLGYANDRATGRTHFYKHHMKAHAHHPIVAMLKDTNMTKIESVPYSDSEDMPPSSVKKFLKEKASIDAMMLSDFKQPFKNQYYHSFMDHWQQFDSKEELVDTLVAAADATLPLVVQWLAGNTSDQYNITANRTAAGYNITANRTAAGYIVDCFMYKNLSSCRHLGIGKKLKPGKHDGLYVAITSVGGSASFTSAATHEALTVFTATNVTQGNCTINGTGHLPTTTIFQMCYSAAVFRFSSVSPAFAIEDYDYGSVKYPAYTESQWNTFTLQLQLVHSLTFEAVTLALAFVWLGLCVIGVALSNKYNIFFFDPEQYALD